MSTIIGNHSTVAINAPRFEYNPACAIPQAGYSDAIHHRFSTVVTFNKNSVEQKVTCNPKAHAFINESPLSIKCFYK
ncbi:hypothetical protein YPPY46_1780 [Yersinia pestis PY-46]|nr:hypothetical protein YPPY46_1780 [Yersinia pestis PY-46]